MKGIKIYTKDELDYFTVGTTKIDYDHLSAAFALARLDNFDNLSERVDVIYQTAIKRKSTTYFKFDVTDKKSPLFTPIVRLAILDKREEYRDTLVFTKFEDEYIESVKNIVDEIIEANELLNKFIEVVLDQTDGNKYNKFNKQKRLSKLIEQDSRFLDILNLEQNYTFEEIEKGYFTQVFNPTSILDIVSYYMKQLIKEDIIVRRCKNCNHFFIVKHRKSDYCPYVFEDGKVCNEVGAQIQYMSNLESNQPTKLYQLYYKRYYTRLKRNTTTQEKFDEWNAKAIAYKQQAENKEITIAKYESLLGDY